MTAIFSHMRANDAQVMGDHDDGHAQLFLQVHHQLQDLSLYGHVRGGGRLVCDQQLWAHMPAQWRSSLLTHAAGQLVGILLQALFRAR